MEGAISALDETIHLRLPKEKPPEYCLDCLENMTIRCAWCELPIFIGNPVTLYVSPEDIGLKLPPGAVVYKENPRQVVGCLRMACAQSGADRSGFWVPGADGKAVVLRVMSPLEETLSGRKAVIVQDLADIGEARRL